MENVRIVCADEIQDRVDRYAEQQVERIAHSEEDQRDRHEFDDEGHIGNAPHRRGACQADKENVGR